MRSLSLCVFLFTGMVISSHVWAQGAAPALYGVKEVIIQPPKFNDPAQAEQCGLKRDDVLVALQKAFVGTSVPVTMASEAKPPVMGMARIDLQPELAVHDSDGLDCVTWVSLYAQSRSSAVIAPVSTMRSFTALYWHQGAMVASSRGPHPKLVEELLDKMANQFAKEYKLDQPPDLQQPEIRK